MPSVSSCRALAEAVAAFNRAPAPTLAHYEAVCNALAACASEEAGAPVRRIFVAQPLRQGATAA